MAIATKTKKAASKAASAAPAKVKTNGHAPVQFAVIELAKIKPSDTNPRQFFDEAALEELAASIKTHGLLQPLLVRPNGAGVVLVAGERRWRASKLAGLKSVPCTIREMSEQEALEFQIIENLQRQDVTPFEEAQGYQRLRDAGHDAADIAQRIGKSVRYVWQCLALNDLPEQCVEDLRAGTLSKSVAMEIASLPSEKMRSDAVKDFRQWNGQYLTVKAIREQIENKYRRELKGASFDQKDATLLPAAGSCAKCPKRTGNARDLYPEGRADICTDTTCFEAKDKAHHARQLQAWRDEGRAVITGRLANDAIGFNGKLAFGADQEWALPDEVCPKDSENRTWGELLKGHLQPTILVNGKNATLEAFPLESAYPLLKEHHGIKPPKAKPVTEKSSSRSSAGQYQPLDDSTKKRVNAIRSRATLKALRLAQAKLQAWAMGLSSTPALATFFHCQVLEFLHNFSTPDTVTQFYGFASAQAMESDFKEAGSRIAQEWFEIFGLLLIGDAGSNWASVYGSTDLAETSPCSDRESHPLVKALALDWEGLVEEAEAELYPTTEEAS